MFVCLHVCVCMCVCVYVCMCVFDVATGHSALFFVFYVDAAGDLLVPFLFN